VEGFGDCFLDLEILGMLESQEPGEMNEGVPFAFYFKSWWWFPQHHTQQKDDPTIMKLFSPILSIKEVDDEII
jgi:hypothetical protein